MLSWNGSCQPIAFFYFRFTLEFHPTLNGQYPHIICFCCTIFGSHFLFSLRVNNMNDIKNWKPGHIVFGQTVISEACGWLWKQPCHTGHQTPQREGVVVKGVYGGRCVYVCAEKGRCYPNPICAAQFKFNEIRLSDLIKSCDSNRRKVQIKFREQKTSIQSHTCAPDEIQAKNLTCFQ